MILDLDIKNAFEKTSALSVTDLKALNVEVETEGLYDHCCPLP